MKYKLNFSILYAILKLVNPVEANNERNDDFSSVLEQFLDLSSNETTGEHEDKSLVDKYVQKQIKI